MIRTEVQDIIGVVDGFPGLAVASAHAPVDDVGELESPPVVGATIAQPLYGTVPSAVMTFASTAGTLQDGLSNPVG